MKLLRLQSKTLTAVLLYNSCINLIHTCIFVTVGFVPLFTGETKRMNMCQAITDAMDIQMDRDTSTGNHLATQCSSWPSVCLMIGEHRRWWANIKPTVCEQVHVLCLLETYFINLLILFFSFLAMEMRQNNNFLIFNLLPHHHKILFIIQFLIFY